MENTEAEFQRWIVKIFHLPTFTPFRILFFWRNSASERSVVLFTEEEKFFALFTMEQNEV